MSGNGGSSVTPIPAYKMAEHLARSYGAKQAIVILDLGDGIRSAFYGGADVRDTVYMLACATEAVMRTDNPEDTNTKE